MTYMDGSKFNVAESREVLATNGLIHRELQNEIQAIMQGRGLGELPDPVEYFKTRR